MEQKVSRFDSTGSLDLDNDPKKVVKDDYILAENISNIGLNGQSDTITYLRNGNQIAIVPPTIAAQPTIKVIYVLNSNSMVLSCQFFNLNGNEFPTNLEAEISTTNNLTNDTASFASAIQSAAITAGFSSAIATGSSDGSGRVTVNLGVNGFDYILDAWLAANTPYGGEVLNVITIQEAWDNSVIGLSYPVGSYDYLDELFLFTSSVQVDPVTYPVIGISNNSGNLELELSGAPNLTSSIVGKAVSVQGITIPGGANGIWIVSAASFSSPHLFITLYNSPYATGYVSGGTVTLNIFGFLNISASSYNNGTQAWTTTVLLQTKQINSRTIHPYRGINADSANNLLNFYWTDGNDVMRIFSYEGAYITNGAIFYYNALGQYTYEDIAQDTVNIVAVNPPLAAITNYSFGGGNIESGNWRYTGYLSSSSEVATGTGIFTNPINIYNGSIAAPSQILGTPGSRSSMTVQITFTEIPSGFTYLNLAGINYSGASEISYLIKTVPIPAGATTLTVTHTGFETYENYTDGYELPSLEYLTAGTQDIVSNTLMYSDLTAQEIDDYTAVSQLITHFLTSGQDFLQPTGDDQAGYTFGEYQNPLSTVNYTGYMLNETYRFWACYELYSGVFTPLFWIDDIRIDLNQPVSLGGLGNVANPISGQNARRTLNDILSYNLSDTLANTTVQAQNSYVFYVGMNLPAGFGTILINGIPLNDLVKHIHIFRTDNTTGGFNEVLGCGIINRHVVNEVTNIGAEITPIPGPNSSKTLYDNPFLITANSQYIGSPIRISQAYNSYAGLFPGTPNGYSYGLWEYWTGLYDNNYCNYSCSWYSPDWIYGQADITYEAAADTVLIYGQPDWNNVGAGEMNCTSTNQNVGVTTTVWGTEIKLSGYTNVTSDVYVTNNYGLAQAVPVGAFAGAAVGVNSLIYNSGYATLYTTYNTPAKLWLYTTRALYNGGQRGQNNPDIGMYYAQYYRNLGSINAYQTFVSKFGAITQGTGIPTGAYFDIQNGATQVNIFGGDTFTQKSYLKIFYPADAQNYGGGVSVVFFCQNRMNFNMRDPQVLAYPASPSELGSWVNATDAYLEIDNYDDGYTPRNPDQALNAFNPQYPFETYFPNRKIYSLVKPQGSLENYYQVLSPLNFNDDETGYGINTAIARCGTELYLWQQKKVWRHYYSQRGTYESNDTAPVTLGSGAPFTVLPKPISNYGCSNIFSMIKGRDTDGKDVIAWIDIIEKKVMMLTQGSDDPVEILSDFNMEEWFYNNLNDSLGDVPILGAAQTAGISTQNSIVGVFDEKRKEFRWVIFLSYGSVPVWSNFVDYEVGKLVFYGTYFNGSCIFWRALMPNLSSPPSLSNPDWQFIPSSYSIIFGLGVKQKGKYTIQPGWKTFMTTLPYFFAEWKDTYLSVYPLLTYNGMYLEDVGSEGVYYEYSETNQTVNGLVQYPVNDEPDSSKIFNAQAIVGNGVAGSASQFAILNYTTENNVSYLNNNDFTWFQDGDNYINAIKQDTTNSMNNNGDTDFVWGNYLLVEYNFIAGNGQNFWSIITKYKTTGRTPMK